MKTTIGESRLSIYLVSLVVLIIVYIADFLIMEVASMTKSLEHLRSDGTMIFIVFYLFLLFRKFTLKRRCIVLDEDKAGLKYGAMFNDYTMVNIQDIKVETGTYYGFDFIKLSVGRREMVLYRYMFSSEDYELINQVFLVEDGR